MPEGKLCQTLEFIREACGITRSELAGYAHIPEKRYTKIERGSVIPTADELRNIANVYNLDIPGLLNFPNIDSLLRQEVSEAICYLDTLSDAVKRISELSSDEQSIIINYRRLDYAEKTRVFDFIHELQNECDDYLF